MMNSKKLIFTFLFVSIATCFAFGQQDFSENNAPKNRNDRIKRMLNLTADQMTQIRQINRQGRVQMREAQKRFRQTKNELDQLVYADTVNEVALKAKLREVVEAQGELTRIRTRSEFAIRGVLSPEQLVKFRDFRNRQKENQRRRQMRRQKRQRQRNLNRRRNQDRPPQNKQQRQ